MPTLPPRAEPSPSPTDAASQSPSDSGSDSRPSHSSHHGGHTTDTSDGGFTEPSSSVEPSTSHSPEPPSSSEAPPSSSPSDTPPPSSSSDPEPSSESPPPSTSSHQPTQSPDPPSSSQPPTSSEQPPTSSNSPTQSERPPSSSEQPQPSSSDSTQSSAPPPSSSSSTGEQSSAGTSSSDNVISPSQSLTTSSPLQTSLQSTTPSSNPGLVTPTQSALSAPPSTYIETTLGSITTTDEHGRMTTKPAPSELTSTIIGTGTDGKVWTVTQVVKNTGVAGESSAHGGSGFFDNAGAVAGTFVVVGLAVAAGIIAFAWYGLRRRRRQMLDRDVSAAAAAAAAANQPRFEDDDDSPAMTQYGSYYATTHGSADDIEQPNAMRDYMDPSGGYDPYASHLTEPMIPGDRPCSTATAPGVAGLGAQPERVAEGGAYATNDAYANDGGYDPNHFVANSYDQNHYAAEGPDFSHTYGDPQYDVAHQYAQHESTYNAGAGVATTTANLGYDGFNYGAPTPQPYKDDFSSPERAGQYSTGYGQQIPR